MKLYLIRHGQSETNLQHRHGGWIQTPLTEKGEEDARRAGARIAHVSFDKIYTSDLLRAMQTADLALPEGEKEALSCLREVNVGSLQGRLVAEVQAEYGEDYLRNKLKKDYSPYGGETRAQFRDRVVPFLAMLEQSDYENVAVFSHGGTMEIIFELLTGSDPANIRLSTKNGAVSLFEYADGQWRLRVWNDIGLL